MRGVATALEARAERKRRAVVEVFMLRKFESLVFTRRKRVYAVN